MKCLILIAVLAALAVYNDAASIPNKTALYQEEGFVYHEDIDMYQRGDVKLGDVLFFTERYHMPGIPNTVQRIDISYRGNSTTRISGVRVNWYLGIISHISSGALGTTHITIRATSEPSQGIFLIAEIWGHYVN